MNDLVGQSLGRYHIVERLGEGGMATVYKAFDTRLERYVAIKIILPGREHSEEMLRRFEREAKVVAQMSQDNIVRVLDYGDQQGLPFLVMEFVSGGTLKQRLGKPMKPEEAAKLLAPIARALQKAHERNVIHRDVKPSNILITDDGKPMLSDFGVAKVLESEETLDLTGTGLVLGTPEYMAPEQASGKADRRSDIYSLGIVFYELVTGRRPFEADTPLAVMIKQVNEPLPSPRKFVPNLPEMVEQVLFKVLAKNPKDRYQNAEAFAAALDGLIPAEPSTVLQAPPRRIPGKRVWALSGGLVAFLALVIGGILAFRHFVGPANRIPPSPPAVHRIATKPAVIETGMPTPMILALASATTSPTKPPTQAPVPSVVCAASRFGCAVIKPGQTIKIGLGAPLTGGNAFYGIDISNAEKIAARDAGTFDGFQFEVLAEDDHGLQQAGATAAKNLASDPTVVAVAGHIFSAATQGAIPIYEKAGIPMMSPSATNAALTQSGSKVFNRLAFTDAAQGKFAAEYLYNKLNIRQLAVMHDGAIYGKGLATVVQIHFTELGGTVVAFTAITPGQADYSASLSAIASKKPQALFYGGYASEGAVIANQMAQSGLKGVILFSDDGLFGADFINRAKANAEGVYAAALQPPNSDAKTKFDAEYSAAYGQPPGTLTPFTWAGYDSAAVLIHVIEQVAIKGSDGTLYVPREALVDAVRHISGYQGISGAVTCDPTGECAGSRPTFYVVRNSQWVQAGS